FQLSSFPAFQLSSFPAFQLSSFPAFQLIGPCNIMGFEGLPAGEMDCWQEVYSTGQHLQQSLSILSRWLPWEADRCLGVELTDAMGIMVGCLTPCVRQPVLTLPSGRQVLWVWQMQSC
ncbi:MAG: hypothetical protein G5703_09250, partial [Serratia symbiotica]|nr:hypothetical protein [Serratia symbiotica]